MAPTTSALILLAFCVLPQRETLQIRVVDRVEENHVYDENAKPTLTQLLFWKGDMLMGWELLKGPQLRHKDSVRVNHFGQVYTIEYKLYHRTDTQYDVEREYRDKVGNQDGKSVYERFWAIH